MKFFQKSQSIFAEILKYVLFIAFIVGGIFLLLVSLYINNKATDWIATDSTIVNIAGENVDVKYFVTSLSQYLTGRLNEYTSTWKVGDIIPIKYNPTNPAEFVSNTGTSKVLPIVVSSVFIASGAFLGIRQAVVDIKGKKKPNSISSKGKTQVLPKQSLYSDITNPGEKYVYDVSQFKDPAATFMAGEFKTLNKEKFVFTKKRKGSLYHFYIKDKEESVVYECDKVKYIPFIGADFAFKNNISGDTTIHKIAMYAAADPRYVNPFGICSYYFKFNKKKIWDYLNEKNIKIARSCSENERQFAIYENNSQIALVTNKLKTPSSLVHLANFRYFSRDFEIDCDKEHLDIVAICCYTFSRLSQYM